MAGKGSFAAILALAVITAGCATAPSPAARREHAEQIAAAHGWQKVELAAGAFKLAAYLPDSPQATERLALYIEGDGLAWLSRETPSADPTPIDPVGLRLALAQPGGAAAYLGRPCQYVEPDASQCPSKYWTDARFALEVVTATNGAIDQIKARFGARRLVLIGYSGGAAVAALVAVRRNDVDMLVSVAGNLDPAAWTRYHRLPPLHNSQIPVEAIPELMQVRQVLFAGGRDDIIPVALMRDYADRFPLSVRPELHIEPDFNHHCCWVNAWPRLWSQME